MAYTCPRCHLVSFNPTDERVGWCAACDDFTRDTREQTVELVNDLIDEGRCQLAAAVTRRLLPRLGMHTPGSGGAG